MVSQKFLNKKITNLKKISNNFFKYFLKQKSKKLKYFCLGSEFFLLPKFFQFLKIKK